MSLVFGAGRRDSVKTMFLSLFSRYWPIFSQRSCSLQSLFTL